MFTDLSIIGPGCEIGSFRKPIVFCILCTFTCTVLQASDIASHPSVDGRVIEFLESNCYHCHDPSEKSGGLDLTTLPFDPADSASMRLWSMVLDRVADNEMPPEDDSSIEKDERSEFVSRFEKVMHQESALLQKKFGRVRARRLNRFEFENTLHDLLGVDIPISEILPAEISQDGFNNIADAQQISHHLLQKYLEGIDRALEESFFRAQHAPEEFSRVFYPQDVSWNEETRENGRGPHLYKGHALSFLTSGNFQGRLAPTTVDKSGWYRITIRAKAHQPPDGRGVWTQIRTGVAAASAPALFWAGYFEATEEPQDFTLEAWIRKGHRLEVRPGDHTLGIVSVKRLRDPDVFEANIPAVAMEFIKLERVQRGMDQQAIRKRLFDDLPYDNGALKSEHPHADLTRLMVRFACLAFRRKVDESQLKPHIDFARSRLDSGARLLDALKSGYKSILSSPRFLYFNEQGERLDNFNIASRLSYFIWSSMPDAELLALAEKGSLEEPTTLREQVDRMLDDQRAAAFITNFSDTWLNLKEVDFTTPDTKLYPEFDHILKHSMVGETHSFLNELLRHDRSVTNVIDSDFAILNERLAKHYGIERENLSGKGFHKIPLEPGDHRGGLLVQGSILKVTANGTTTSPVIRGVWLQEHILGEPISPPPDDVPAVEPDIRGATTIRDQLEKHRSTDECMACHKKIDPPGFALESYDVIGGWRENYRVLTKGGKWKKGPSVEPAYHLSGGETFSDIEDFKTLILQRPDQIAKNLVRKVLTYATGASIRFADRREINRIVEQLKKEDYGFRSLIHACVQSEIFRTK